MGQYDEMDKRILAAVEARNNPLYERKCAAESERLAEALGCPAYRVIDRRLQALRKAGKIRHFTKSENNGQGGWHVVA